MQPVPDPASPDFRGVHSPLNVSDSVPDFIQYHWIHPIEHPEKHSLRSRPQDAQDHQCDGNPDNGICHGKTQPDADDASKDRQAGQPITPRVVAVGYESCAADLLPHPDPEGRYEFIAKETYDCGCRDRNNKPDRLRIEKALDGFVACNQCTQQDQEDNRHPGQILGFAISVGEAPGWPELGYSECNPKR